MDTRQEQIGEILDTLFSISQHSKYDRDRIAAAKAYSVIKTREYGRDDEDEYDEELSVEEVCKMIQSQMGQTPEPSSNGQV